MEHKNQLFQHLISHQELQSCFNYFKMKNILCLVLLVTTFAFFYSCGPSSHDTSDQVKAANKKVLVLSIDGGGIKGILPAYILTQIEQAMDGKQAYQLFDVIGGTSTGGIISLGLTTPYGTNGVPRTATQVLDFYMKDCGEIFYTNRQKYSYWPHPTYGPSYYADSSGHGVEAFLRDIFGNLSLAEAEQMLPNKKVKQVFTTSYLVNSTGGNISDPKMGTDFGPYLFNWYDAKTKGRPQNYFLWEAARATSAAPGYFPLANVGGGANGRSPAAEKWAIDGGVMSNDPAMWAVTECLRTGIAKNINDIVVISLGCGLDKFNGGINVDQVGANDQKGQQYGFWGTGTWGTPGITTNLAGQPQIVPAALSMALYANQFVPDNQLQRLADATTGFQYIRVQMELPPSLLAMDSCQNTSALQSFASKYFTTPEGQKKLGEIVTAIRTNL